MKPNFAIAAIMSVAGNVALLVIKLFEGGPPVTAVDLVALLLNTALWFGLLACLFAPKT